MISAFSAEEIRDDLFINAPYQIDPDGFTLDPDIIEVDQYIEDILDSILYGKWESPSSPNSIEFLELVCRLSAIRDKLEYSEKSEANNQFHSDLYYEIDSNDFDPISAYILSRESRGSEMISTYISQSTTPFANIHFTFAEMETRFGPETEISYPKRVAIIRLTPSSEYSPITVLYTEQETLFNDNENLSNKLLIYTE